MSEEEFLANDTIQHNTGLIEMSKERAFLEALPMPSLITDLDLRILESNDSWKHFVEKHSLREEDWKSGTYYTEVCDRSLLENEADFKSFTEGLNQILTGKVARFDMEYQTSHHAAFRRIRLSMNLISGADLKGILFLHFGIGWKPVEPGTKEKGLTPLESGSFSNQSVSQSDSISQRGGVLRIDQQRARKPSSIGIATWEWDIPSDSVRVSNEANKIFGFNLSEKKLQLDSITTRIHPEERSTVMQRFAELLFRGRVFRMTHHILSLNGTEHYVLSRAILSYSDDGVPSCVTGFFVEITDEDNGGPEMEVLVDAFVNAFNNSLVAIGNCASSIMTDLQNPHRARLSVSEIKKSVEDIHCLSRLLPLLGEEEQSAQAAH